MPWMLGRWTSRVLTIAFSVAIGLAVGLPLLPGAAAPGFVWGTAELIETGDAGHAFAREVASDAAGNAIAVWQQSDGTSVKVWANRFVPGLGWGGAETIETSETGSSFEPQIAVDPMGNAMVVWRKGTFAQSRIWANRFVPGVGWGTAELIEAEPAARVFNPQVALDAAGNAVAVWQQANVTFFNITANRFVPGIGWGTAETIETEDLGNALNPQVAVDPAGNAIAVWHQDDGTRHNTWANRFVPGVGWGTAELIENDDTGGTRNPQVTIDLQGNATAVWSEEIGTTNQFNIWANRFVPGDGWSTAELIPGTDAGDASGPQLAVDPQNNVVAVWHQHDGTRISIAANRFVPEVGWDSSEFIETDNAGNALGPQVAVDLQGNAVAVWHQHDGTRTNIWANRFVPGSGWAIAELLETDDAGDASGPRVAMDAAGNAVAVWGQDDGTLFNLWANRGLEDSVSPDVAITSPADGAILASTSATVTGTASDEIGVDAVELSPDGTTWALATGTTSWSGSVTLAEGPNTIFARATDTAGNMATVSIAATVDTLDPTLGITSPSDGAILASTSVGVLGTASDNEAVEKVELSLDETTYVLATGTTSWSGALTLAEGPNTIHARATDTAGNMASASIAVTVDTVKPTALAGEDQTVNPGATVSFDASASTDDVAIVSYAWGFGDGTTGTGETTTHVYTDPGSYTVTLTVRDAAGNEDTDVLTVTVETEPGLIPPEVVALGIVGAIVAAAAGLALLLWRRRAGGIGKG